MWLRKNEGTMPPSREDGTVALSAGERKSSATYDDQYVYAASAIPEDALTVRTLSHKSLSGQTLDSERKRSPSAVKHHGI
ncbi:uncharacterized protein N7446_007223 [Penicillium canescens]|uniref:Uncharacterized protein n=1 Tax=Penicillium canescens TaxID=5083 RepID=A0AAD6ILQ9_PENCN|nr:uncharacterized protein N7446_007223 [Penicillium canescens]KAJ6052583.1 hypothetical protein N7460_003117 [Penicillium canescens]KAJ6063103.1 hypothetical protein N7446_007223 [Penicillium canescens]